MEQAERESRRQQKLTVGASVLDLYVKALNMQSIRLAKGFDRAYGTRGGRARVADAHFLLNAARNIWLALKVCSGGGCKSAKAAVKELGKRPDFVAMRHVFEHLDEVGQSTGSNEVIVTIVDKKGGLSIRMKEGTVEVTSFVERLNQLVAEVRGELEVLLTEPAKRRS